MGDVKFELLMEELLEDTHHLPKLAEFIDKTIPRFKN